MYENEPVHNYFDNAANVFEQYNHHVHINYNDIEQDLRNETFHEEIMLHNGMVRLVTTWIMMLGLTTNYNLMVVWMLKVPYHVKLTYPQHFQLNEVASKVASILQH